MEKSRDLSPDLSLYHVPALAPWHYHTEIVTVESALPKNALCILLTVIMPQSLPV